MVKAKLELDWKTEIWWKSDFRLLLLLTEIELLSQWSLFIEQITYTTLWHTLSFHGPQHKGLASSPNVTQNPPQAPLQRELVMAGICNLTLPTRSLHFPRLHPQAAQTPLHSGCSESHGWFFSFDPSIFDGQINTCQGRSFTST